MPYLFSIVRREGRRRAGRWLVTLNDTEFRLEQQTATQNAVFVARFSSPRATNAHTLVPRAYVQAFTCAGHVCACIYTRRQGSQVSLGPHWHNTFTDVTLHSKLLRCHTRIPLPPPSCPLRYPAMGMMPSQPAYQYRFSEKHTGWTPALGVFVHGDISRISWEKRFPSHSGGRVRLLRKFSAGSALFMSFQR